MLPAGSVLICFTLLFLATEARATGQPGVVACVREMLTSFHRPDIPNHAVITYSENERFGKHAPEIIEHHKKINAVLPDSMLQSKRSLIELIDEASGFPTMDEFNPLNKKITLGIPDDAQDLKPFLNMQAHETGHQLSLQKLKAVDPALHAELMKVHEFDPMGDLVEVGHAIDRMKSKIYQYSIEGNVEAYRQGRLYLRQLMGEQRRLELLPRRLVPRGKLTTIWIGYDEVFADLLAVAASDNLSAVEETVRAIGASASDAKARSFAISHGKRYRNSDDVHLFFSEVRSHLGEKYLRNTTTAQKKTIIERVHQAMVNEIRRLYSAPQASLDMGDLNEALIAEIDRLLGRVRTDTL